MEQIRNGHKLLRKSLLAFVISLFFMTILSIGIDVHAAEKASCQQEKGNNEENDIKRINTVCAGLPYHKMRSHGWGTVRLSNGSTYIDLGSLWQCDNCHLVLVTEGDYVYGSMGTIGKWATLSCPSNVTSTVTYIQPPSSFGYTGNNYLTGYKFFIN